MGDELQISPVEGRRDWEDAHHIRQVVFVEEQRCSPEEEWDEFDQTSRHLVGRIGGKPAATARWREVSHAGHPAAKLERFAVMPEFRGAGVGRRLIHRTIEDARAAGFDRFVLHAQAHLTGLYGSFGFVPVGDIFYEVGIPHQTMVLEDNARSAQRCL